MTSACFSRGHTGFSRNATLVATVNPPALAGGVFKLFLKHLKRNVHPAGWAGGIRRPFTKGVSMHPGFCESIIHVDSVVKLCLPTKICI